MRFLLSYSLISYLIISVTAQNSMLLKTYTCDQVKQATDFETAIDVDKVYKVKLVCSPSGRGNYSEVASSQKKSKYFFEKEHNVVWLKFRAVRDSKLNVILRPQFAADDYDFLIFKEKGSSTKRDIVARRLKPIRSNMARTKDVKKGVTGLSYRAENTHVSAGVNPSFSKYLEVKKDEIYYIAVDNVYEDGGGVIIEFDYFSSKKIKGLVLDDNGKVQSAEVIWENATTGKELNKTKSDSVTGEFEMDIIYNNNPNINYTLSVEADSHFFAEENYTLSEVIQMKPKPIKLVLPELAKGKRARLNNMNFQGGVAILLKSAFPTLKRLARLMKKNPDLLIRIDGHTNGCPGGKEEALDLSIRRARTVKDYLIDKGIDASRIKTEGYGCSKMLFPVTHDNNGLNRRVEIVVIDY